jgi:transposase
MQITTIGLDIAKNQVHGIDAAENVVVRKQLRRSQVIQFFQDLPPCLVGLEACATSHYWARELSKLGHEVRLMPAKDVKAYIKRNKNDAADAEAICEAVRRPTLRFVQVKSAEQQAQLMQHRARDLLMRQRTQLINAMRSTWPSSGSSKGVKGSRNCWRSSDGVVHHEQPDVGDGRDRDARRAGSQFTLRPDTLDWQLGRRSSGHRRDWCIRHCCNGDKPQDLPIRARLCGLDWAGAATCRPGESPSSARSPSRATAT